MNRHPAAAVWRDSLPIGGVDGTLRSRFTQPGLRGNVRARQVRAPCTCSQPSGCLTNSVGEPLVQHPGQWCRFPGSPSAREGDGCLGTTGGVVGEVGKTPRLNRGGTASPSEFCPVLDPGATVRARSRCAPYFSGIPLGIVGCLLVSFCVLRAADSSASPAFDQSRWRH